MKKLGLILILLVLITLLFRPIDNKGLAMEETKLPYVEVIIKGEVLRPDIYRVPKGTEVEDVLKLAGLNKNSVYCLDSNIANENMLIFVKRRIDNPININAGKKNEIENLPGIGKITLTKILDFLKTKKFTSWDEFKTITRINNEKLLEIKCQAVIR